MGLCGTDCQAGTNSRLSLCSTCEGLSCMSEGWGATSALWKGLEIMICSALAVLLKWSRNVACSLSWGVCEQTRGLSAT